MILILLASLFLLINIQVIAEEEHADISIKGIPTYDLIGMETKKNITISRYLINVTFVNQGTIKSEETLVVLQDDEGFNLTNEENILILDPNEEQIVTFDWSTIQYRNHNFIVSYKPEKSEGDSNYILNEFNSGSTTFIISMVTEENNKGIPGFEIVFMLLAIILTVIYLGRKKIIN